MSKRPEPNENTSLIIQYLLPFLNGLKKVEKSDCGKVQDLVKPPYLYFFKRVFPDFHYPETPDPESNPGETIFAPFFQKAFPAHVCNKIFEDAEKLRRMISVATNGDAGDGSNTLSYDDNRWVQENAGQFNILPNDWTYNRIASHMTPVPKKIDNLAGVYEEDWGWPQLLSLFIFWLQNSFDKSNSDKDLANGEFFIGICPFCMGVFERPERCTKIYCSNECRKRNNNKIQKITSIVKGR